jgi:HEAT repeats
MNLHEKHYRFAIKKEFTQEEFGRFIYFERDYDSDNFIRPGEDPSINYQSTFVTQNKSILITYRDDAFINLNWVKVTYINPTAHKDFNHFVSQVREKVPKYSLEELQGVFSSASDLENQLFAVYAACVSAPWEFDISYFDAVKNWASHENPIVRAACIIGIGYIGLTEYKPILEQLSQDENSEVQSRALTMLESFAELETLLKVKA